MGDNDCGVTKLESMRERHPIDREKYDSIDKFLGQLEGQKHPDWTDRNKPKCDRCSTQMKKNRTIYLYCSNYLVGTGIQDRINFQTLYCNECHWNRLKFPMTGCIEILLEGRMGTDWTINDLSIMDLAIQNDGEDWSPEGVMEELFQMPYEQAKRMSSGVHQGPQDVIDVLDNLGLDIRDIVDEDGNIDLTDEEVREMHDTALKNAPDALRRFMEQHQ